MEYGCGCPYHPREALLDADVVYTDVWTSMGQEEESEVRRREFKGYTVDPTFYRAPGGTPY